MKTLASRTRKNLSLLREARHTNHPAISENPKTPKPKTIPPRKNVYLIVLLLCPKFTIANSHLRQMSLKSSKNTDDLQKSSKIQPKKISSKTGRISSLPTTTPDKNSIDVP
jgi:hypothetical protein